MNKTRQSDTAGAQHLCLACGLCCTGAIFADVKLQPGDDPKRLKSAGLSLASAGMGISSSARRDRALRIPQPCCAFENGKCRIYADRPRYCRGFECLVLKNLAAGRISREKALQTVQQAREQADRVIHLLRMLGDTSETIPVSARFHNTAARLGELGVDKETGELYSELTLAMHDLNFVLCDSFYPAG